MTSYALILSLFLTATASATNYNKNNYKRNYDDSGESYSSHSSSSNYKNSGSSGFGGSDARSSSNNRNYNNGYDADDYIPPVGIQHNNDYSGLGDGYQDFASNSGGNTGAISYSHVVTEHRPIQRPGSPVHRIRAEGSNVIEKPVHFPFKFQIPVIPAYDRPLLPVLPLAPVSQAVLSPVKYPIHFFKPFSYLTPQKHSAPAKSEQPEYLLTKVPLVYHATYSESAGGASSGLSPSPASPSPSNFHRNNHFNHGAHNFNHNFNYNNDFGHNFNHGSNFHLPNPHFHNINPTVSSPGSPVFSPPIPLVPTPTPYSHNHRH